MTGPDGGGREVLKRYQQIAAALTEAIREGAHPPGERLPSERDLAEEFGVSRPTIREAMIALEIAGLIEAKQGSGAFVLKRLPPARPAPELDIGPFELTEARRLIEAEVCALAAKTISDAEIVELEQILSDMADENDRDLHGDLADRRFHVTIASATRNAALVSIVENLWDLRYASPLCREMLARAREVGLRPRLDDHRDILTALKARDPVASRAAMKSHLGQVIENLFTATEIDALARARRDIAKQRTQLAKRARL